MAPLPENNTSRLFVDYTSGAYEHTLQLRFPTGVSAADATVTAQDICTALAPFMNSNDSFIRARWSAAGSNIALPTGWVPVVGTSVGAAHAEDPESAFVSVNGRTLGGRRVRWEFFSVIKVSTNWPDDNRYGPGESANADDIVDAFEAAAILPIDYICGIDGLTVIVYQYLNIAKNGYWQRKQRT